MNTTDESMISSDTDTQEVNKEHLCLNGTLKLAVQCDYSFMHIPDKLIWVQNTYPDYENNNCYEFDKHINMLRFF